MSSKGIEDILQGVQVGDVKDFDAHILRAAFANVTARAEAAEAALATARVEGWRPIESAPRDGSHVLLWYTPNRVDKGVAVEGFFDMWYDREWMVTRGANFVDRRLRQPTHWMPLPCGPVEGA